MATSDWTALTSRPALRYFVILLLILMTLAAFWPTLQNDFINFDDGTYVTENVQVLSGLTVEGARWAFKTTHAANWHPLTWMSHMADVQLFGTNPRGHHLVSLLIHAVNTVLFFLVLRGMTGALWRSFAVAALFAVHPLRVESVAWIAERKDVLSAFFWILTMAVYLSYARSPGRRRYFLLLFAFAAGLMAKPMLVTLPFVLLLLDYWPLQRIFRGSLTASGEPAGTVPPVAFSRAIMEKAPLLAMSAISSVMTLIAQREGGALQLMEKQFFWSRILNALSSYTGYIFKTIWPVDLVLFYPHPVGTQEWWKDALWTAAGSAILLGAATYFVLSRRRRRPYLTVGWFWYLGALVPVIGLIQVGAQAMADRYTYLPLVGLSVAGVWGAWDLSRSIPARKIYWAAVLGTMLAALMLATRIQTGYWKNSATVFGHCLKAHPGSWMPHHMYALALMKEGRYAESVSHALEAARLRFDEQRIGRFGAILEGRGRNREAAAFYSSVLRLSPDMYGVRHKLADARAREGRLDEAIFHYREVIRTKPDHGESHNNLAVALVSKGQEDEAMSHFRSALAINPSNAEAHNNLGVILARKGFLKEATENYYQAIGIKPDYVTAMRNLSDALRRDGKTDEALSWSQKARRAEAALAQQQMKLRSFHGPDKSGEK